MGKTVLITGSSRGIGRETALYLADKGFDIVLNCSRSLEKALQAQELIRQKGREARLLQFDVSNREEAAGKLTEDIEKHGVYYGVVLNAGINSDAPFPLMDGGIWDKVINTNLNGFYNTLSPVIMSMLQKREGRIIAVSSVSGLTGNRGQVNYSASKAGIIGAVKALARETAKRGITVNCIAPGIIETDMTEEIPENIIKDMIPMRRMGSAREIASAVNYLLSEDASYITGQVISINGGLYL